MSNLIANTKTYQNCFYIKTYKEITENIANAKEIIQNEDDQNLKL